MKLLETQEERTSFLVLGTEQAHCISALGCRKFLEDSGQVFWAHLSLESLQKSAHHGRSVNASSVYTGHFGSRQSTCRNLHCVLLNCKTFEAGEGFLCIPSAWAPGLSQGLNMKWPNPGVSVPLGKSKTEKPKLLIIYLLIYFLGD